MTTEQLERAVALDAKAMSEKADGPVWIQIARVGQWAGHPAGSFQLTPKIFDEIVANFRGTRNRRIPIDFEHVSEMDPREGTVPEKGAPAQGWMIDLDNRGEAGLWALADWKEPARSYIREGKYMFFSPTIRFNARDPQSGTRRGARLSSGALTNKPFLDGMMPVAAKDVGDGVTKEDNAMEITKEQYDAEVAKVASLNAKVESLTAEIATLTNKDAASTLTLKDVTSKQEAAEAELVDLRKYKSETEARVVADRVDLAFSTYKDDKKLGDHDKVAMTIVLKNDPETFERLYPKAEPGAQHMLRNLTGKGDGENGARPPAAGSTEGEPEISIVQLADKIQADKKCDRDTAFTLAEKQIKAARSKR